MKVTIVTIGRYGKGYDSIKAFEDDEDAWRYALGKCKKYFIQRKNLQNEKGFKGLLQGKHRWVHIQEVPFKRKR